MRRKQRVSKVKPHTNEMTGGSVPERVRDLINRVGEQKGKLHLSAYQRKKLEAARRRRQ